MSEGKRKFGALADLRRAEGAGPVPSEPEAAGRGKRPLGKRSDPEWKLYSHFLKKKTQREAAALLLAGEGGPDLSDILQALLEGWIEARRRTGDGSDL